MSTSSTSSTQNKGRNVASDDMVSHISASTDGDFAPIARGQGRPSFHNNDRQWRDDDNIVDDFMFNPDITNLGINPDLFDVLMHGSPLDFYMLIVDSKIINNIVIETNKFAAQQKEAKLTSPFARLNKWRSTKWYRKVALDALLNIAVVNSMVLFNRITSSIMSITDFRTSLVEQLIKKETVDVDNSLQTIKHQLEVVGKNRCYMCYSIMSQSKGRNYAQSHSTKSSSHSTQTTRRQDSTCITRYRYITLGTRRTGDGRGGEDKWSTKRWPGCMLSAQKISTDSTYDCYFCIGEAHSLSETLGRKFQRKLKPINAISSRQCRRRVNKEMKEFHSLNITLNYDFVNNQIIPEPIETSDVPHTRIPLNQNLSKSEPIIQSVYSNSIHINRNLNDQKPTDFGNELACWAIEENISLKSTHSLLKLLRKHDCFRNILPIDPRTLLQTPRYTELKDDESGSYWHRGLYKGIKFDDGVTVVPHNWLVNDNTKCSFPPGNNDKIFYKSVADMVKPKDNWNVYKIKKINGSFDTFKKARDKLNDVTRYNLSEVGTDFEEINKSSRKIRAAAKIYSSDEEWESTSELSQFTKFPSPPCSPNMFHSPDDHADDLKCQIEPKKDKLKIAASSNIKSHTKKAMQSKTQNSTPIKKLKTKHYSLGTINEYTKEVQLVNCTNKKQAVYNSQGIGMLEDTQNNLSAPNIQTSSGIEYTKEVQLVNCTNKKQAVYNSQGIGMLEDTQNNLSAPNIQTSSGIEYTKEVQLVNCTNKKQAVYNSQGIGMLEDTQNNLSAPNIQTSSGIGIKIFILNTCALLKCISTIFVIEKWLIHLKKNQVVLNKKLDKILENQEFIKVHIHSAKHDEIPLGNDFLEVYQKFIPIKCKQDLIEIKNLLTNEFTFKVNLGKRMFGYSGEDVGRFIKQVLDSTFSVYFSTKISYTGKCHNKTTPNSKKVALSLLKVYNLITETCHKKFPNCSHELIRKHTDSWLRHCTQRFNQQKQRLLEVNELESIQLPHDDE
ncbi:hypothetical protein ACI65C_013654 [Semiaphis heraclei]